MRRFLSTMLIGTVATMLFRRMRNRNPLQKARGGMMGRTGRIRWLKNARFNMALARIASRIIGKKMLRRRWVG